MASFSKKITYMFSSGIERVVLTLINDNLTGFIDEECCDLLAHAVENKSSKFSKAETLECILKNARKVANWSGALRALMVFHKLTHMQGDILVDFFTNNQIDAIAKFQVPKTPLKLFVHSAIVPHYYKYLQKLIYNYEDLRVCFFADAEFSKRLQEDNLSLLHFISKIQNILKYLIEILPLLEVSLSKLGESDLIKQITYFCLTDCYYYYTYTNQSISIMIAEIFKIQKQDAIFLFELYSENIQITKELEALFLMKIYLKQFSLKIPDFFKINIELNKRIELYISSLKKKETQMLVKKPIKKKFYSNLEINVDAEEDPDLSNKSCSSIQDLSNVVIQLTTPSFKLVQKKELFKPPITNKKEGPFNPKIRIISPTGQIQDGMKVLLEAPKGPNKSLTSFNPFMARSNSIKSVNKERGFGFGGATPQPSKGEYQAIGTSTPIMSPNESLSNSYFIDSGPMSK